MYLSPTPNVVLTRRRCGGGMPEQAAQQLAQVEPSVEAIGEGAEVMLSVFSELLPSGCARNVNLTIRGDLALIHQLLYGVPKVLLFNIRQG